MSESNHDHRDSAGSRLMASCTRCWTSSKGMSSGTDIRLQGLGRTETIEAAGEADPLNMPTTGSASFANMPVGDGGSRGSRR